MATSHDEHPLDVASEENNRVNDMLADTDGAICEMSFNGAIGYHVNIATGETDPEYLWKVALLQALDESVFEMMYVDADEPDEARRQVERELGEYFDRHTTEYVGEQFEGNLRSLIETQQQNADDL